MSRIGIWFDGGGHFGCGNICRSEELAKELKRRGHEVSNVALSKEARQICSNPVSDRGHADVVLLDVPYPGDQEVRRAHDLGAAVLALDYEGTVAPEAIVSLHDIRERPSAAKFYVGVEFAIIRSEIRAIKTAETTGEEVLVVLGGGASQELFSKIVRKLPATSLCLVQGPNAKPLGIVRKNLRVLQNPPELPQLMGGCRWAVTSGGTTMLEMLYLGKATHVVPRTEEEKKFAHSFANKESLLGIGLQKLSEPRGEVKKSCERKGPALIDGHGAERIADIVEELL